MVYKIADLVRWRYVDDDGEAIGIILELTTDGNALVLWSDNPIPRTHALSILVVLNEDGDDR